MDYSSKISSLNQYDLQSGKVSASKYTPKTDSLSKNYVSKPVSRDQIKYGGISKTSKLDYERTNNKYNRDLQSSYSKKSDTAFDENEKKKKDLMGKLQEMNKKYSPSKSHTDHEKNNSQMKREYHQQESHTSHYENKASSNNSYKPSSKGVSGRYEDLVDNTVIYDKIKMLEKELSFISNKLQSREETVNHDDENDIEECSNLVLRTLTNLEERTEKSSKMEMIESLVHIFLIKQEALVKVQDEFKQKFMDIANSLQQIHSENEEIVGTSFACIEKLTSDLEVVSNTCHSTFSEIQENLEQLRETKAKKPSPEAKGKMSFGASPNISSLKRELEQKEAEARELKEQLSETEAEAKEKLSEFKQEINNQEGKINENEDETKLDEELETLVNNYNETVQLYEKCNEEKDAIIQEKEKLQEELEHCKSIFEQLGLLENGQEEIEEEEEQELEDNDGPTMDERDEDLQNHSN